MVKKILLIACVFVLMITVFAGCSKSQPDSGSNNSSSTQQTSTQHEENKQPQVLKAGEKAVGEEVEITLLSAKRAAEYTKTPAEGQGYILLRFKVKNISKEETYGDVSSNLQWNDKAAGMRRGSESSTGVKLDNPENTRLAPGAEAEFEAVYSMPKKLAEVEFHYVPGYDPVEKARWSIAIE